MASPASVTPNPNQNPDTPSPARRGFAATPAVDSSSHDLVSIGSGVYGIPSDLPQDTKNSMASSIYRHLKSAGQFLTDQYHQTGDTLNRELAAAGNAVTSIPSSLYHAAADPETQEESQRFGKGFETKIGPTGRLIDRTAVQPLLNAVEDYKNGRVSYEQFLSALPEALGGSVATVVTGKVAGDVVPAIRKTLASRPVTSSVPELTPTTATISTPRMLARQGFAQGSDLRVPPSEEQQAAAAYLRKLRLENPDVHAQVIEASGNEAGSAKEAGRASENVRGETPATVVGPEESASEAQKVLDHLDRIKAAESDPVNQLAKIRERLAIKPGSPTGKEAPLPEAAQILKTKLSDKEIAARASLKSETTGSPDTLFKHTVVASDSEGNNVGTLRLTEEPDSGIVRVDNASSELPKGSGLGTRLYQRAITEAKDRGATSFVSDGVVSEDAAGVWRKLRDSGLPVEEIKTPAGSTFHIDLSKIATPEPKIDVDAALKNTPNLPALPEGITSRLGKIVDRAMLPPESIDLTDDWKRAVQDELAKKGVSGGSDANSPTFFSKAERVANQKVPNSASGDQILSTLKNNGVKASEIDWLGLGDYLKGKPKVSKADLQQYINEHKIALNEVDLGGPVSEQLLGLTKARDAVYVENNRIWADSLRRAPLSSELFNAMHEGDPESVIEQMPKETQDAARRFVETDQLIHNYDKTIEALRKNVTGETKYGKWTLPGDKSNYTEKLLTLPDQNKMKIDALNARLSEMANRPSADHAAHPEWKDEWDQIHKERNSLLARPDFKSSHFDEPNVLAHVRYDDRPSVDGKKTLFLEELQSDWHQKGKIEGYRTDTMKNLGNRVDRAYANYQEAMAAWSSLGDNTDRVSPEWKALQDADRQLSEAKLAYNRGQNAVVPDAPFKNDWHELVMKRMLRHAAENGYDRLAWTTGEQQAARYDLSRQISKLEWHPVIDSDDGKLWAFDHSGNAVMQEQLHPSQLADYIGKDPAKKLLESPTQFSETGRRQWKSLEGVDLKLGGEWAKALYDRAIPNFLRQYAKKWNAKVGTTDIVTGTDTDRIFVGNEPSQADLKEAWRTSAGTLHTAVNNVISAMQDGQSFSKAMDSFGTEQLAEKLGGKMQYGKPRTEKVHYIEITPQMKKSVLQEGQPISRNAPTFDWRSAVTGRAA